MTAPLEKAKFNVLRREYIKGHFNHAWMEGQLHISKNTVTKYVKECREIEQRYPNRLKDFSFRLPKAPVIRPRTNQYLDLINLFPVLIEAVTEHRVIAEHLWLDYKRIRLTGYCLHYFEVYFLEWRRKTNSCCYAHRKVKWISLEDRAMLVKWTNSFDHKNWERATVILGSFDGRTVKEMARHLGRTVKSVLRWIDNYKEKGIAGLIDAPYTVNADLLAKVKVKQDRVIQLIHQTPQLHGLNRASWKLEDLAKVYTKIYGEYISHSTVWTLLDKAGYGFRRSRERLTSPDPDFKVKLDHIKNILSNLSGTEKFFSVDEFGHFSVNVKGGRSYTKNQFPRIVETSQKSQGWLIITAALELSTNQVTHFYSLFKNTDEMIKLLDVLLTQYQSATKLYFSWDCASWHASKKLYKRIEEINTVEYRRVHQTPLVELAPLPATAQFLNIIESVFSGLAKSVIHNSNYASLDECKSAIDRHFLDRNQHFLDNPKRAGHKIWGNEVVQPVFNEANNCKKPPCKVTPLS